MKRQVVLYLGLLSFIICGRAQEPGSLIRKTMVITEDTVMIDSLSIIPGSLIVSDRTGNILNDTLFIIDYPKALLVWKYPFSMHGKEIHLVYRSFPYPFSQPLYHKNKTLLLIPYEKRTDPFGTPADTRMNGGLLTGDQLESQGSLLRGITVGNNQDMSVNSSFNLQLSGKIGPSINILAAITDNSIPIQPDGYSQQIQDFDRVFIQLNGETVQLNFGDFEVSTAGEGYFMRLNKKVQGGMIRLVTPGDNMAQYTGTLSGAVSKGKYSRNQFMGQEGNQGPYKLKGDGNESVIIVLAGSERVYIDGKLLRRGQDNDYVIDYNLAEITFTTRQPVTKDKRILVEFEYSEKSYARFMITQSNTFSLERGRFWLNIFSEHDSKNQNIQQELSPEQKEFLSTIGDSLTRAVVPNVEEIGYTNNLVLYKKVDTLVNSIYYRDIYVYSTHPDSARYKVGFSFIGENRGNYRLLLSSANGKVFGWVAPENGVSQGDYEPVVQLITPKKKQMVTLGGRFSAGRGPDSFFELALSKNDLNTFSSLHQGDNTGIAVKGWIIQDILQADTANNHLRINLSYQLVQKNFEAVERYREAEYERDWNVPDLLPAATEHTAGAGVSYRKSDRVFLSYRAEYLDRGNVYNGMNHRLNTRLKWSGFLLESNGSLLTTASSGISTSFLRHSTSLSHESPLFRIGIREMAERNRWSRQEDDSITPSSFAFQEYEMFMENAPGTKNQFLISYKNRQDFLPSGNELRKATVSHDAGIDASMAGRKQQLTTGVHYRRLHITGHRPVTMNDDETLLGRVHYSFRFFDGGLNGSTYYELGKGQELKRSFAYIEVPQGQGIYRWTDYNNNTVKELDEFDIARFQDEAAYIRVLLPSNEYEPVTTTQINQVLNIQLQRLIHAKGKTARLLAAFSDQMALRMIKKSSRDHWLEGMNPFHTISGDTSLVNVGTTIRNTFSWNRNHPVVGADYIYQDQQNRILLLNGFDTRGLRGHTVSLRYNVSPSVILLNQLDFSMKIYESQYFSQRNFDIRSFAEAFTLRMEPGVHTGLDLNYSYSKKRNDAGAERSTQHKAGLRYKRSLSNDGNMAAEMDYLFISYTSAASTAMAYEMLEGFLPGSNLVWNISYIRRLVNGIEVSLLYQGRTNPPGRVIHTGSLQARALF